MDKELEKYKEAFGLFDRDGDGSIDISEIGTIVRALGWNPTEAQVKTFLPGMCSFTLADLLTILATIPKPDPVQSEKELMEAFRVFDKDGDGYIPTSELKHVVTSLGEKLSEEEASEMIREADPEGVGRVDYKRFIKLWTETVLPDGRKYYFNPSTGESTWEKPAGFVPAGSTLAAPALSVASSIIKQTTSTGMSANANIAASWREMSAQNGRKYYYNSLTKVSVWEMPPEYKEHLERMRDPAQVSREKGEGLFMALLREKKITSTWSWEETLREIISHPNYKCLATLAERKQAFARYIELQREVEREEQAQRDAQAREDFVKMLKKHLGITAQTRWTEAQELLRNEKEYLKVKSPKDRMELFDSYINELRKTSLDAVVGRRKSGTGKFAALLLSLPEIAYETRWRDAVRIFSASELFQDPEISTLEPLDLLVVYEDHIKHLERIQSHQRQLDVIQERRRQRSRAADFEALLRRLIQREQFTPLTAWQDLFPLIKDERSFIELLAVPAGSSTPLDIYWDLLDELQQEYLVERKRLEESPDAESPFKQVYVKEMMLRRRIDIEPLKKEYRRQIDRYKHLLKRTLSITPSSTYASSRAVLLRDTANLPEVLRQTYFEKYIQHLKRKQQENRETQPIVNEDAREEVEEGEVIDDYWNRK